MSDEDGKQLSMEEATKYAKMKPTEAEAEEIAEVEKESLKTRRKARATGKSGKGK
jgi:hypothetical protein